MSERMWQSGHKSSGDKKQHVKKKRKKETACALKWERAYHAENPKNFPSGPVVKTASFQSRGYRFHPWSGNYVPTCHGAWPPPPKKNQQISPPKKTHRKKIGGAETRLKRQAGAKLEYGLQSHGEEPGFYSVAAAKSRQSCPTLCDPIDGSPPGSPIPGILQAITLEWVAISYSNAWKWKMKVKTLYPTLSNPMDCSLPGPSVHGTFQTRVLEWGAIAFFDGVLF